MTYIVLIADIVGSRKLDNRRAIQERLETTIDPLNADKVQLASPYTITLGDEFQAVFDGAERVFRDVCHVMSAMHPVELRFAIAVGPLDTPVNPDRAIGMDGPAFHRARDLLGWMKKRDRLIDVAGLPEDDGLLDGALGLFNHQLSKWRVNRFMVLERLMREEEVTAIAGDLDITEQSVYKNIRDGDLDNVIKLLRAIAGRLDRALDIAD